MSNLIEPRRGRPSTYLLPDGISQSELLRLHIQDELFTTSMGGALPEQADPTTLRRVLDVGCGTGHWLIATAKAYPTINKLIGVDISAEALAYAREQAQIHGVSDRVEFLSMDGLRVLDFPTGYFDLVNQRFGQSYLRTWEWTQVLQEYRRVTRAGGVIRLTEGDILAETSSAAQARFHLIFLEAFVAARHLSVTQKSGITDELEPLLRKAGLKEVQVRSYALEYRAGTREAEQWRENLCIATETLMPFIRKWGRLPADYEELRIQLDQEMQQPDFVSRIHLLTAWGRR
jgi:ubiquinone/menaquinone biosynthesis C-methylase UbiE